MVQPDPMGRYEIAYAGSLKLKGFCGGYSWSGPAYRGLVRPVHVDWGRNCMVWPPNLAIGVYVRRAMRDKLKIVGLQSWSRDRGW